MTRRIQRRSVLIAALALLLSFTGIHPSAAWSGLPYWTEVEQSGAVPDPLWDGASAYHEGLFYVSGGRGPFRRGLDLTHQDTFRFDPMHGWTEISQSAAERRRERDRSVHARELPR